MIGYTIFALLYLAFTLGVATIMADTTFDGWWKSLGIVLLVEFGAVALLVLISVAESLVERGI